MIPGTRTESQQGLAQPRQVSAGAQKLSPQYTHAVAQLGSAHAAAPSRSRSRPLSQTSTGAVDCQPQVQRSYDVSPATPKSESSTRPGCPFAPRATGNIPMEDLIYMLNRMGVETGVDINKVMANAEWVEEHLGKPIPAMLGKAGVFPDVSRKAA